ncbi:MAG: CPBP family intramembrane metalloprotease [Acidobacteriota bacterium]|nr:CPBP family intramembrane metalloprotease [Acidobacteriota bacterium]
MRQHLVAADRLVAPLLLFVCFYVATVMLLVRVHFPFLQWIGLVSVTVATAASVAIWERGQWPLGLFVPPRLAIREFFLGSMFGVVLIASCALVIVLASGVVHEPGRGFPWYELFAVFVPAAVHEELLFRGYAFQKLYRWRRGFALFFAALVFAGLHAGNPSVSPIGLVNIFLGGLLLGLAFGRYGRLWFPIGLHLMWNITSGPILGHEVSGYEAMRTILIEIDAGPDWMSGGRFGIEGSAWMTVTEALAIALLAMRTRRPNMMRTPSVSA